MADSPFVGRDRLPDLALWTRLEGKRVPLSFELELTARCNNDCRHCYINLPAGDLDARGRELSAEQLLDIARQAVDLGAVWCLLTGGEPLLRPDFAAVYLGLRRLGLLVSVFTNGCLVTPAHVGLFQRHPPRELELTVYGVTRETYEAVSRTPGSYAAFRRGLSLLLDAGIPVSLKAVTLRSNLDELPAIGEFCRRLSRAPYRFDPTLHLRYDGDMGRNEEIRGERLTAEEIIALERADPVRLRAVQEKCGSLSERDGADGPLLGCGAGREGFTVGYDGTYRLCSSLWPPETLYDLRSGTLHDAWERFTPEVLSMRSNDEEYRRTCAVCALIDLCGWCPAHAYLETGRSDAPLEEFCATAHERARSAGV